MRGNLTLGQAKVTQGLEMQQGQGEREPARGTSVTSQMTGDVPRGFTRHVTSSAHQEKQTLRHPCCMRYDHVSQQLMWGLLFALAIDEDGGGQWQWERGTPYPCVLVLLCVAQRPLSFSLSLVSLIRGQVVTTDGTPLVGVNVSFVKYPKYGYTITRQDGT